MKHYELTPEESKRKTNLLVKKSELALAWAQPDAYSVGYASSDLMSLIRELLQEIKRLSPTS